MCAEVWCIDPAVSKEGPYLGLYSRRSKWPLREQSALRSRKSGMGNGKQYWNDAMASVCKAKLWATLPKRRTEMARCPERASSRPPRSSGWSLHRGGCVLLERCRGSGLSVGRDPNYSFGQTQGKLERPPLTHSCLSLLPPRQLTEPWEWGEGTIEAKSTPAGLEQNPGGGGGGAPSGAGD